MRQLYVCEHCHTITSKPLANMKRLLGPLHLQVPGRRCPVCRRPVKRLREPRRSKALGGKRRVRHILIRQTTREG